MKVAYLVDVVKNYDEQVVVITALVERRYIALLGVEQPTHSLACAAYASKIVLGCSYVLTLLNGVARLGCVLDNVLGCEVSANE